MRICDRGPLSAAIDPHAQSKAEQVTRTHKVGLIVVDSITAPFRGDEVLSRVRHAVSCGRTGLGLTPPLQDPIARAEVLLRVTAMLKRISHSCDAAVLVLNQVRWATPLLWGGWGGEGGADGIERRSCRP